MFNNRVEYVENHERHMGEFTQLYEWVYPEDVEAYVKFHGLTFVSSGYGNSGDVCDTYRAPDGRRIDVCWYV